MREPCWPHGPNSRDWKSHIIEIDESSVVFAHFRVSRGSHWNHFRGENDVIMKPNGVARGEATQLRGILALSPEAM